MGADREARRAPAHAAPTTTASSPGAVPALLRLQQTAGNAAVRRILDPVAGGRSAALPDDLRRSTEAASGVALDDVTVHHGSDKPAQFGAEAYTFGEHIHLGPGMEDHLPHEAWHVVQQKRGEAAGGVEVRGVPVDADAGREAEADRPPAHERGDTDLHRTTTGRPVLQGVFTEQLAAILRRFQDDDRYEVLARLTPEDLRTATEMGVAGDIDPGTLQGILAQDWQGVLPAGPARAGANMIVTHATLEPGAAPLIEYLRPILAGDIAVAYVEDCPVVEHADSDEVQSEVTLPGGNEAFLPPPRGSSKMVEGTLVGWRDDQYPLWFSHLVNAVEPGTVEVLEYEDLRPGAGVAAGSDAAIGSDDAAMDDLVAKLQALSIGFDSDHDGRQEQHEVTVDRLEGDADAPIEVGLRSKFAPLRVVLQTGKWLKKALDPSVITPLTNAGHTAKLALDAYSQKRGKGAGQKLQTAMNAVANILRNTGSAATMPKTKITDSHNGAKDRKKDGKKVVAENLSLNPSTAGSPPQGDSRLMDAIRTRAGGQAKSYKQMHLLNDNLFGPGEFWNLTPGPAMSNSEMERKVESPLKGAVIDHGLVVDFTAEVTYKSDPEAPSDAEIGNNPDKYRFDHIDFTVVQKAWDQAAGDWVAAPAAGQDPLVKKANGERIQWKWGSLTPLVPRADLATGTKAELVASGVPDGLATRILAVRAAEPAKFAAIGGKDKKEQLKNLLYAYEKTTLGKAKVQFPGWNDWKATQVTWP